MGILSDDEFEFENNHSVDGDTPPVSPRLAATHAQAIAANFTTNFSELNSRAARDYASLCCEEFSLTDTDKDDVLRTSQMHTHLIAIRQYTRAVALTQSVNRLLTESFLESAEFKDHITRRIQATFLDANIPTYVRGCTSRLIQHMQENPASWRIPPVVHAHFVNSKVFRKAVAAIASNFRGDMRRKIKKSIADKSDIGACAKKLCVKGYQPTSEHWRRFAILRCYMRDWEKLPVKPGKGRGMSFWAFIDTKLDKLRLQCARATVPATEKAIKEILKTNLQNDEARYTGPASGKTKLPARVHLPEWQRDHAKAVQDMLDYTVEASTEDDIDDDESADANDMGNHQGSHGADPGTEEDRGHNGDDHEIEQQLGHANPRPTSVGANPNHQVQATRTGNVLVPETQESSYGTQSESNTPSNRDPSSSAPRTWTGAETQSGGASFIPETPLRSIASTLRGTETQQSAGSSGSTSGQVTQTGWATGALVDRRPHTSRAAPSPIARPAPLASLRPRHHQSHPTTGGSEPGS